MKNIVKIFGEAFLLAIAFLLTMMIVLHAKDDKGHEGMMQITGYRMAEWKEDEGIGFDIYEKESQKILPEIKLAQSSITTGTYTVNDLFEANVSDEIEMAIALKKMTTPDGREITYPSDTTDIIFDSAGIYIVDFEIRNENRRVSQRQIKIPVNAG